MRNILSKSVFGILLLLLFMFFLDVFTAIKGSKESCDLISIGDTKTYISLSYDLYKEDSTGEYYMYSPCGEEGVYLYYIKFENNIILDRVKEIIISFDPKSSIELINNKLVEYGFNDRLDSKEYSIELLNRKGNIVFNLGTFDQKNNYVPIYFTIIK